MEATSSRSRSPLLIAALIGDDGRCCGSATSSVSAGELCETLDRAVIIKHISVPGLGDCDRFVPDRHGFVGYNRSFGGDGTVFAHLPEEQHVGAELSNRVSKCDPGPVGPRCGRLGLGSQGSVRHNYHELGKRYVA